MDRGVIYFNSGVKCLPRLLVSINSLRKHYGGNICIISTDDNEICRSISNQYGAEIKVVSSVVPNIKNKVLIEKTVSHIYSPYDISIWIDSDTLVNQDVSQLFDTTEKNEFCVARFSNWTTTGKQIKGRICAWRGVFSDEDINLAISFGKAINCGVISFVRESDLMKDWFKYAILNNDTFIPDEVSCQILLTKKRHFLLDSSWNVSCKYDDPKRNDAKIVHFHGRKHCRKAGDGHFLYGGDIWVKNFLDIAKNNICNIKEWYLRCGDKYIKNVDII